jgi:FtsZ-binding cell division protein ZapB
LQQRVSELEEENEQLHTQITDAQEKAEAAADAAEQAKSAAQGTSDAASRFGSENWKNVVGDV